MTNASSNLPSLGDFQQLYRTAYEFSDEVSNFREDVPLPAHETLAQAAYTLIRVLDGHSSELSLAETQCHLAIHQAAREGVNAAIAFVEEHRELYKDVTIGESVPELIDKLVALGQARDLVNNSDPEFIWNHLDEYVPAFRRSRDLVRALVAATGDLNAKRAQQNRDESQHRRRLLLMAGALAVAIVGLVMQQGCWEEETDRQLPTLPEP